MSDWHEALAPTPECIDLARLGDALTPAEREHLDTCARCQSELALFREVTSEEASADSRWIAGELRRRGGGQAILPVQDIRDRRDRRDRPSTTRVLYALAAALVIVIGAGTWLQLREASLDLPTGPGTYRSVRLEVLAPSGDLAQAPNELRWKAVPDASRYHVQLREVDATPVWSSDTTEPYVILPPDIAAQFAPGKTLQWSVTAYRGNESLATSETQNVRVIPVRVTP